MQFTGIKLIALPTPANLTAVSWKQAESTLCRKPFNGLHLSARLEEKIANTCAPRRVEQIAYKPVENAQLQVPVHQTIPEPVAAAQTEPVAPAKPTPRRGAVALRQALAQLGVAVTRIAELTRTDRRSAHKHVHATPSSKVKPWGERSTAEQQQALELARKLLT